MTTRKISELNPLEPSANLQLTFIPVVDTVTNTTRKLSLQQINDAIEASIPFAQAAYNQANTATTNSSTADQKAVSAGNYANSAFAKSNTSLNVQSGGSITGDLSITGNVSITGCTVTLSVSTLRTTDHIIDLGHNTIGAPTQNAGIRVLRGDELPVQIRWNESSDVWQFTTDGTNYFNLSNVDNNFISASFNQANTANILAQAAFDTANSALTSTIDLFSRETANAASSYANGAYGAANTADAKTIISGNYANAAYAYANTGNILVQAAFDNSNTKLNLSGGTLTGALLSTSTITANGAIRSQNNTSFLKYSLINENGLIVTDILNPNTSSSHGSGQFNTTTLRLQKNGPEEGYRSVVNANSVDSELIVVKLEKSLDLNIHSGKTIVNTSVIQISSSNNSNSTTITPTSIIIDGGTVWHSENDGVGSGLDADLFDGLESSSYANSEFVQSSYDKANTANDNAIIAGSYANSAFVGANTADQKAVTSGTYANAAYSQANTSTTNAATADQRAVTSGTYANAAFDVANSATSGVVIADQRAVTSGSYANSAYVLANVADQRAVTSGSYANSAYATANNLNGLLSGNNLIVTGNLVSSKIVYSTNNSVTQDTSRGTGVTLHNTSGDVTLVSVTMTSGQVDAVSVTNNKVRAGDFIICSTEGASIGSYISGGYVPTDGVMVLWIRNITSSTTASESPTIRFIVIQPTNV